MNAPSSAEIMLDGTRPQAVLRALARDLRREAEAIPPGRSSVEITQERAVALQRRADLRAAASKADTLRRTLEALDTRL